MHGAEVSSLFVGETLGSLRGYPFFFFGAELEKGLCNANCPFEENNRVQQGQAVGGENQGRKRFRGFNPGYKDFEDWEKVLERSKPCGENIRKDRDLVRVKPKGTVAFARSLVTETEVKQYKRNTKVKTEYAFFKCPSLVSWGCQGWFPGAAAMRQEPEGPEAP